MADSEVRLKCKRCQQEKSVFEFFKDRDGFPMRICKKCIQTDIDEDNPKTFLWVLEALDRPFIQHEWNFIKERYKNKPCLGRYLAKMNLCSFKHLRYTDSTRLNEEYQKEKKGWTIIPPKDCIIWYNWDVNDIDESIKLFDQICEMFPGSKVIGIPNGSYLECISKDEAIQILDDLKKYIEDGQE